MDLKRLALTIAVMIFMVFAVSSVTEYSYAYWASNVTVPTDADTIGNITVGTFAYYESWNSTTTYTSGDQVSHNGVIYQAKKASTNVEPGVASGWKSSWLVI